MANKKQAPAKSQQHEKTLMEKIGEQASHLKHEIIIGKDHLVEAAEQKIAAVKATIKKYRAKRKKAAKKIVKKPIKKSTSSIVKKVAKRIKRVAPKKRAAPARPKRVVKKSGSNRNRKVNR